MNIKLLNQIKEAITNEPRQFVMENFFYVDEHIPNCGTACCIAGWAIAIHNNCNPVTAHSIAAKKLNYYDAQAEEILNIPIDLGRSLFYIERWPMQFNYRWRFATDAVERAKIACDRIDHFIATNGEE
jgi:hypothetical protein